MVGRVSGAQKGVRTIDCRCYGDSPRYASKNRKGSTIVSVSPASSAPTTNSAPQTWIGKELFVSQNVTDIESNGWFGRTNHKIDKASYTGVPGEFRKTGKSLTDAIDGARSLVLDYYSQSGLLSSSAVLQDPSTKEYYATNMGREALVDPSTRGWATDGKTRKISATVTVTPKLADVKAIVGKDSLYDFSASQKPQTQTESTTYRV